MKKKRVVISILVLVFIVVGGVALGLAVRLRGSVRIRPAEQHALPEQIVFYSQDDKEWAIEYLGDSPYTIVNSGCLVTCIASALSMNGDRVTPGELNALFSENAVYDAEGNMQWANLAKLDGFQVEVYERVSEADIARCLSEGHYPIVRVRVQGIGNIHYVLIVGTEDGEYLCMDPLRGELTKLSDYLGLVYAVRCVWNS